MAEEQRSRRSSVSSTSSSGLRNMNIEYALGSVPVRPPPGMNEFHASLQISSKERSQNTFMSGREMLEGAIKDDSDTLSAGGSAVMRDEY